MLTSELIQMLLNAQSLAEEEVEIRGAFLNDEDGLNRFHQCTIVGVQLFHSPDTDEQHVKLIIHEQPNLNGDKILAEIKDMVSSGHQWKDKRYFSTEG
jgi:hypothetical protein